MRGVQDIYGVPGYADNRKPCSAYSPGAIRLCIPVDVRHLPRRRPSYPAGFRIHTFSDSAACPQTWKPNRLSSSSNSNSCRHRSRFPGPSGRRLSGIVPHGQLSRIWIKRELLSPALPFRNVVKLGESAFNRRREG